MGIGCTYSPRFARELGLQPLAAFGTLLTLRDWSLIRLPVYWDEVESGDDSFNWQTVQSYLELCERQGQRVVLTLGCKAPRWPEFYPPKGMVMELTNEVFVERVLGFVDEVVQRWQAMQCITYWQIENEPFDPSGPNSLMIPHALLSKEVELVRSLDQRPIVLTAWGNQLSRQALQQLEPLTDVIGIDLYPRQHIFSIAGKSFYRGPADSYSEMAELLAATGKPVWITELQAEPWEKDHRAYLSEKTESFGPADIGFNVAKVSKLPVQEIYLWGSEYWLYRAQRGDQRYLDAVCEM